MNLLYRAYLYVVTFYFAVLTPVGGSNESSEDMAWGVVFGSVIHAFIAASFFYFFEWPKIFFGISIYNDSFWDLMLTVGLPVGIWVFLGALHLPALQDELKKDKLSEIEKKDKERMELSAITTREWLELLEIKRNDPEKYRDLISVNYLMMRCGGKFTRDYEIFKRDGFLEREAEREGVNFQ